VTESEYSEGFTASAATPGRRRPVKRRERELTITRGNKWLADIYSIGIYVAIWE
jgi:hypothetical protein